MMAVDARLDCRLWVLALDAGRRCWPPMLAVDAGFKPVVNASFVLVFYTCSNLVITQSWMPGTTTCIKLLKASIIPNISKLSVSCGCFLNASLMLAFSQPFSEGVAKLNTCINYENIFSIIG